MYNCTALGKIQIPKTPRGKLFSGFDYIRVYIDNLLVITKGLFHNHLTHLDKVLAKLEKNRCYKEFFINFTSTCQYYPVEKYAIIYAITEVLKENYKDLEHVIFYKIHSST